MLVTEGQQMSQTLFSSTPSLPRQHDDTSFLKKNLLGIKSMILNVMDSYENRHPESSQCKLKGIVCRENTERNLE